MSRRGTPTSRIRPAAAMRGVLAAALLAAAGCDIPTDVPRWETTWVVPGDSTVLGVGELLPEQMELLPAEGTFALHLDPFGFGRTLGEMCGACAPSATPVPKPAFTATFAAVDTFPDEVAAVESRGGTVTVDIANGLAFDPLRPGSAAGAERGEIRLRLLRDGDLVTADTVTGDDVALPPGVTVSRVVGFSGGRVAGGLTVEVFVDSPEGDPVPIDPSETLEVDVPQARLDVSRAELALREKEVRAETIPMDVGGIDRTVVDHVQGGSLRLSLDNPWDVSGPFELRIVSGDVSIRKSFPLQPGATSVPVQLTGEEFRSFLGRDDVAVESRGVVSSAGGTVAVEAGQLLLVDADLELVIGPEGS